MMAQASSPDMSPIRTYRDAISYLARTTNYEQLGPSRYTSRVFKLERMFALAARLGDPHRNFPSVHIAGSKGKGSVAYMVERIARAAGARTGLYVSPHVTELTKRIQLSGKRIPRRKFAKCIAVIAPAVEAMNAEKPDWRPTFFEIMTAAAFVYFDGEGVGLAVFETGMGGRLDATNVLRPAVAAITSIGKDHTRQLGDTLEAIAGEKAGILKSGLTCVVAQQTTEVDAVIRRRAEEVGARLVTVGREIMWREEPDGTLWVQTPRGEHHRLAPGMAGRHQCQNGAVAVGVVDELRSQGFAVDEKAIRAGLAKAKAPARFEIVRRQPLVILDGAHNEASARALAEELRRRRLTGARLRLIVGFCADKDVRAFFAAIAPLEPHRVVISRANSPRAAQVATLEAIARGEGLHAVAGRGTAAADVEHELASVRAEEALCVTGSFYLAGEARDFLLGPSSSRSNMRA